MITMLTTTNGKAPPALTNLTKSVQTASERPDRHLVKEPDHQSESEPQAQVDRSTRLWMLPSGKLAWLVALLAAGWSALVVRDAAIVGSIAALMAAAALAWTVQSWRVGRGRADSVVGYGTAGLITISAIALSAVFAGTALNPMLFVLPVAVGILAVVAGRTTLGTIGLAIAAAGGLGVALRSTIGLDEPAVAATLLAGSSVAMSAAAYALGSGGLADPRKTYERRRARMSRSTAKGALLPESIAERISSATDPHVAANLAAETLLEHCGAAYVAIAESIPDTTILMPIAERASLDLDADVLRRGLNTLSHEALADGRERWMVDDGKDLDALACRRLGVQALLVVPLRRLNRGVGAVHMAWTRLDDPLTLRAALSMAAELGEWITPDLAIARVAGEIERGYINAIASMSASLDDRDAFTRGHSRRVAKVALEIAEQVGLSDHEQRQLVYAAEIHDLGRVGVSDRILGKPGALTDEEWSSVRMIPALSAGFVEPVSFHGEVHEAIRHLRERWDGNGYPDGATGRNIPMLARILAVADAYDAMTSPRPYRQALSEADALRQLWWDRGKAYDPEVVELFVMSRAPGEPRKA